MESRLRIAHIITTLGRGGAELMLYRLLTHSDPATFDSVVFGLAREGELVPQIEALGVPTLVLGMASGVPDPRCLWRVARELRRRRVQVVQTWMYHSDLLGGLAARMAGRIPVAWGIHHTTWDRETMKPATRACARLCARLSRALPSAIVCCSHLSQELHIRYGYDAGRCRVIPNGFDTEVFRPLPEARAEVRREHGLPPGAPLVGLIARFDSTKDHGTFVAAAERLHRALPEACFLLCGRQIQWDNETLAGWIDAAGLRPWFRLGGLRDDLPRIYSALDVNCSSSRTEAMPLAVGEAMACGVPCVVTDVGDSARLLGDTGRVVPAGDADALAGALREVLSLPPAVRGALGESARQRIQEHYSLASTMAQYSALWRDLARSRG
ncbi:MAG: glycosyltransferase [Armatimonadetes bacterium]|nr:glycosyltransferase [Armatimonadota bacterium]